MELYDKPANIFVAGFIGSPKMNFIDGAIAAKRGAHTIGVRPEHFELSSTSGEIEGTVDYAEVLGSDSFLYIATPAGTLTVRQEGKTGFGDGATVHVTPLADQVHRFDETGQRLD